MTVRPEGEWVSIGERLRVARESAGMSVRELARQVGVSASHVSQVERGLASFSVRALYSAAGVLGLSMDSLFDDRPDPDPRQSSDAEQRGPDVHTSSGDPLEAAGMVQRASTRPRIPWPGGTRWERLTPQPETGAEFIEVVYPPARTSAPPADFIRHSSREYGLVLTGELTVQVGFDTTVLQAGDSIAFDSVIPHKFWNATRDEVRAVWFIWDEPQTSAAVPEGSPSRRHRQADAPTAISSVRGD